MQAECRSFELDKSEMPLDELDLKAIRAGYSSKPARSFSLQSRAYVDPRWFQTELLQVLGRSWQWVGHESQFAANGDYLAIEVAGKPIVVLRSDDADGAGELRAFYNVCKHRAHHLLEGQGNARSINCPYHSWTYDLHGQLQRAPHTEHLENFNTADICLDSVQVEVFCGFVFVNLDAKAETLEKQSGKLADEIQQWAPDISELRHAHRLSYSIDSNWKNVVDNFLECYHCARAHRDFVSLVDMGSYKVTTHGIYSSHMADAGQSDNSAYSVENATVRTHAVWWLWPTTCLMRYPGRSSMIVLNIIPVAHNKTLETYDFFYVDDAPNEEEWESIRYLDEVLQREDIALVESVQRGMNSGAFEQGRIVHDPSGSGNSEHAVHHFHGLVLDAYERGVS